MTTFVKHGDSSLLSWSINADLTGADVRLLARSQTTRVLHELDCDVVNPTASASTVQHLTDGTLPIATYDIEFEIVLGGEKVSAPSQGYASLVVGPDLG